MMDLCEVHRTFSDTMLYKVLFNILQKSLDTLICSAFVAINAHSIGGEIGNQANLEDQLPPLV